VKHKNKEDGHKGSVTGRSRDPRVEADRQVDRGIAAEKAGNKTDAEAAFVKAITVNPLSVDGHLNLGVLLIELEQPEKAVKHLSRALQLAPAGHPMVTDAVITGFIKLGRKDLARPVVEKLLAKNPKDETALAQLALLTS
jgi:tetratricopeptide (TPR) repeat protein